MSAHLHLGVALDGAGWHPAAWREPDARPSELFTARYWTDLVREAEAGTLDFATFEDALGPPARLDAVLIASRVAPATHGIGLIPTAVVTHTEPFHLSKAIATLDYVSEGRAGVRVRVSARAGDARHFGRRGVPADTGALFEEAADYVEVLRRLWDSWEDDAEIRDAATGRFADRDKLHYIDFSGPWFSVRGPSITPRPPQGQPPVAALAHRTEPYRLAATSADLGFVTPHDPAQARAIVDEIRAARDDAAREEGVHVLADLLVYLDDDPGTAAARRDRLDAREPYASDAETFAGTPSRLADLLLEWRDAGLSGFRLRPATLPHDLRQITRGLVPELRRRGAFRTEYEAATLRGLFGLPRPANRYAAA